MTKIDIKCPLCGEWFEEHVNKIVMDVCRTCYKCRARYRLGVVNKRHDYNVEESIEGDCKIDL